MELPQLNTGVYLLVKTTADGGIIAPAGLICPKYVVDGKKCKYRDYRDCIVYNNKPLMAPNLVLIDEKENKVAAEYKTQDGSCTWKICGGVVRPTEIDGNVLWFDTGDKWCNSYYSWPNWGEISKINGKVIVLDKKLFHKFNNFEFNPDTHLFYPKEKNGFLKDKGNYIFVNNRKLPYVVIKVTKVVYPK